MSKEEGIMNTRLIAGGALALLFVSAGCQENVPFHFAKQGRVVDSATAQGLVGIEIKCMLEERDCDDDCDCDECDCDCDVEYKDHSKTYSARDGHFYIPYDEPCILFIKDIDEQRNAGWFGKRQVEFCSDDSELLVELTPQLETCAGADGECGD
jgi:hypothetical protein